MPPKVDKVVALPFVKDENKLYGVDEEFFRIQYEAKDKTIKRLLEKYILFEEENDDYVTKNKMLSIEFENDYNFMKEKLDEKDTIDDQLTKQLEQLLKEKELMMNSFQGMLKEKEAEFFKTAGIIKSKTAVYVGRLNKLEEFLEQEEMLEQKYEDIKKDMDIRKEIHQKRLNEMEYSYLHSKTVIKRDKIKQAVDFGMEIRRKIFIESDPVMDRALQENNDIIKNLQVYQTSVTKINQDFKTENEKLEHLNGVGKALQTESAGLMNRKGRINCELDELRQSIKLMTGKIEIIEPNPLKYQQMTERSENLENQTKLSLYNERLRKQDLYASKVELYALQTSNIEYKEYNLKAEIVFLDTLATIKKEFYKSTSSKNALEKEKVKQFLSDLYKQLQPFICNEVKLLPVKSVDTIIAGSSLDVSNLFY